MSNTESIIAQVEKQVSRTHTKQLDISFNELADMYQNEELNISPDFQRLFRWSDEQQSRFIESLLLEMPIPPIFVIETEEGKYELIDGLQRISSYLNFRGMLKEQKDDEGQQDESTQEYSELESQQKIDQSLVLNGCDIVPLLNGFTFQQLPTAFQIRLKRSFIRMQVIRKESDSMLRYYMFKRLNTGGEKLEAQEIRNCNIRLLNDEFADFLKDIAKDENFIATIKTTEEKTKSAYLEELALRFFAYKNYQSGYQKDIEPFLDDYMERVSLPNTEAKHLVFDYQAEEQTFKKVFKVLNLSLQKKAFGAKVRNSNRIAEAFRIYHYESITIGLLSVIDRIDTENQQHITRIKQTIESIKLNPEFERITTGGGKNSKNQLQERIDFVRNELLTINWNNS